MLLSLRSRRGFWSGVAAGFGGVVLLAVLAGAAMTALGFVVASALVGGFSMSPMTSWEEAAEKTQLEVYVPGYLPSGTGEPELNTSDFMRLIPELEAAYPSGLMIIERDTNSTHDGCAEKTRVVGAEEACFGNADSGARALTVRKGGTWIQVVGIADDEAVRAAESLRPVD